jgi:hypothetical protein
MPTDRIVDKGLAPSSFHVFADIALLIVTSQCISVELAILSGCYEAEPHYGFRLVRNLLGAVLGAAKLYITVIQQYVVLHGTSLGGKIHEIHYLLYMPPTNEVFHHILLSIWGCHRGIEYASSGNGSIWQCRTPIYLCLADCVGLVQCW